MSFVITLTMMVFAAVGFAGGGVAFAVARAHEQTEDEADFGMRTVAALLAGFGAVCAFVALGFTTIFAFGGVLAWFSYMLSAQHIGLFEVRLAYSSDDPRRAGFLQRHAG